MKKLIARSLTLALVLSMGSLTAFAAPITTGSGSESAEVKGTYTAGDASPTVYSVNVTWGSMEFTYTDASDGTWNPATHDYDNAVEAGWSCAEGANAITVTNHSNAEVTAALTYTAENTYSTITGSFDKAALELGSAVNTKVEEAPTGTALLTLAGTLASETAANTKLGTVTVTLS